MKIYDITNHKKKKHSFFIKIKKKYKEKMSDENTSISNDKIPIEEDYSWAKKNNQINNKLKSLFIKYPFDIWSKIIKELLLNEIDEKKAFQETINEVLEKEVFSEENFMKEKGSDNIFKELLKIKKIKEEDITSKELKANLGNISPDFIVLNISKENFFNIFGKRKYMFRYDNEFISFNDEIKNINIIGEIKNNINSNKREQRKRYLLFCQEMNKSDKKNYYISLYIFNHSYKKFFRKNFFKQLPCIIGFFPKLFKTEYLDIYSKLKEELNNNNTNKKGKEDETEKDEKKGEYDGDNLIINTKNNEKSSDDNKIIETKTEINETGEKKINRKEKSSDNNINIESQSEINEMDEEETKINEKNIDNNLIIETQTEINEMDEGKIKKIGGGDDNNILKETKSKINEIDEEKTKKEEKSGTDLMLMNYEDLLKYKRNKQYQIIKMENDLLDEKLKMDKKFFEEKQELERKLFEENQQNKKKEYQMRNQLKLKRLMNEDKIIEIKKTIKNEKQNLSKITNFLNCKREKEDDDYYEDE